VVKKSEQIMKRLEEARKKVEDLANQRGILLKQKTELLVAGESTDAVSKKIRALDCEIEDARLLATGLEMQLDETIRQEHLEEKKHLLTEINELLKSQLKLLRDCEALQKQSNLIYKEYMAVTSKIQEKERAYKQHTGREQLWYVCSWAPTSPPASVGALQMLASAETPTLQNQNPYASETQPEKSSPPPPDTTIWKFRVKTSGVVMGGRVKPEGSIVSLPKNIGDSMKLSLEPLGPAEL